jgi:hypothetical protein
LTSPADGVEVLISTDIIVPSPSEERVRVSWRKAAAATDPAEIDNLLFKFRDALHERIDYRRAEAKKLEIMAS